MDYYVVKYIGPFGFIKPWTAVRDNEIFSQQFLTPSIIEGIEKKLFPELLNKKNFPYGKIHKIKRHRLSYQQLSAQLERIQSKGWNKIKDGSIRLQSILLRGVLINPILHLAFTDKRDAQIAFRQHLCLCRNEDMLFPVDFIITDRVYFDTDIERFSGFELLFRRSENSFAVGYNRYFKNILMYGTLKSFGKPVKYSHE